MADIQRVKIEVLTAEAFEPFGEVLDGTRPFDVKGSGVSRGYTVNFETDGTPRVQVTQTPFSGFTFSKLERHFLQTKVCVPLAGSPAVVAVATPTDPKDPEAIPSPDQVRAFLLDGTKGYMFKRATWHSVDRLPLYPPGSSFVVFNDRETAEDLRLAYEGKGGFKFTQEVNYTTRFGITFELVL
jgi:ureidoglycolate lyase